MKKNYRKGGIGAVMDEYERAAADLKNLIGNISDIDFIIKSLIKKLKMKTAVQSR